MKAEAGIAHLAGLHGLFQKLRVVQLAHFFQRFFVHGMEQIEIHMIGLELGQLLVQKTLHIRFRFQQPEGQFGGQCDAVTVAILKGKTHDGLAFAIVVGVGRIHVGNAAVNGVSQHGDSLRTVDDLLPVLFNGGEAHTAEAQPGDGSVGVGERGGLHGGGLSFQRKNGGM